MASARRSSFSSLSSGRDSNTSSRSPLIGGDTDVDGTSNSHLILVHDDSEELSNIHFDFSSDDDDDLSDALSSQLDRIKASSIPPLPSTLVLLYLLSPLLRLGPMLIPSADIPLKYSIPAVLVFALFALLSRQLWYMLAKYVRKADLEEVVLDAFARGRGSSKEGKRRVLRSGVRVVGAAFACILATVYLRQTVDVLLPLLPPKLLLLPARIVVSLVGALIALPFCMCPSLAAKPVVYVTWASIASYIVWFGFVAVAHGQGTLVVNQGWSETGKLWHGISVIAFGFGSSWTLPLYASLKGTSTLSTSATKKNRHSFQLLSLISIGLAVALTLPLCFFAVNVTPPEDPLPSPNPIISVMNAATLFLSIPPILLTVPQLPAPGSIRRLTQNFPTISKGLVYLLVVLLSLLLGGSASAVISDVLLVLALVGSYIVPSLIHITVHHFKRPLSIVLPQGPSNGNGNGTPRPQSHMADPADELLQRKERTLQRRRLGRRLAFDVLAWVVVLPVGGGGAAWAVGRLLGHW